MKIKIKIIVILFFIPWILFAQNKLSLGINFNSELSFMKITNSNTESLISNISERGGNGIGYSLGIQLQYPSKNNFFFRTGINFQRIRHFHEINGLRFGIDVMTGTESTIINNIFISSLGMPLDLGYKIMENKEKNIIFLAGITGQLNLTLNKKSKGVIIHELYDSEELTNTENVVMESLFSYGCFTGIEFDVNKELSLGIEANVRITKNKFKLYLFDSNAKTSFESGLTIRLRRK